MTVLYGRPTGTRRVQDVSVQDATTDTVILPLAQLLDTDSLSLEAVVHDRTITVVDGTKFTVGDHVRIFDDPTTNRYMWATALSIAGNVITLDNLVDYEYPVGAQVTISNINMAVDGSVTPVHFHLRTGVPSIPSSIDITRMIMVCTCATVVDLSLFGDLPALTNGLLFRVQNGHTRNIWNVKTNGGLAGIAYDWEPYAKSRANEGIDGFKWRLTFGSQGKLGVVLRVDADGQLGLIVQDNLSGLLTLHVTVEGHVTDEPVY